MPMPSDQRLITTVTELVSDLPDDLVYRLADAIADAGSDNWQQIRINTLHAVSQPAVRKRVQKLLDLWVTEAPHLSPTGMATALRAAMQVEEYHRRRQQLDLVWSGPDTQVIPLRRTDQALLQLIGEARERLHIVSFAVYKIDAVAAALVRAAERGVTISIYLETPDASQNKITYDTTKALGRDVARRATIYVWPLDRRPLTPDGKHGSLHAKVAVADHRRLLISSANLTEYAMKLNMEMGILIRGGSLPARVAEHLERLVEDGVFTET